MGSQFGSTARSSHWAPLLHFLHYTHDVIFQSLLLSFISSPTIQVIQMLIGLEMFPISNPIIIFVFPLVTLLSLAKPRNIMLFHVQVLRSNTEVNTMVDIVRLHFSTLDVSLFSPTFLYSGKKSIIRLDHSSVFHERVKHIKIDYHFVYQHLQSNMIDLPFAFSSLQFFGPLHQDSHFTFGLT